MNGKFILQLSLFLAICSFNGSCEKRGTAVTFANVCQQENKKKVELKGFLDFSANNFMTMNYRDFYFQKLLMENENGTGGFIEVLFENGKVTKTNGEVKITGKVLRDGNSCILQVEKIESQ